MDARQLRQLLLDQSEGIVKYKIALAIGGESPFNPALVNKEEIDVLWTTIEYIIKQTTDLEKIKANNTADVLKSLRLGKITLKDAKELMEILQLRTEIEELPKLLEELKSFNDSNKRG